MGIKVEPNARAMRRFHDAVTQLQRISGKDFETVIKSEMGILLTQAVRKTKKASAKSVKKSHDAQPGAHYGFEYIGPASSKGKTYSEAQIVRAQKRAAEARSRGKRGRALYYLGGSNNPHRYPDWLWRQIEEARASSLPKRLKARGLAAKMWVHIGNQLGVSVQAPGYVRNAEHYKKGNMAGMVQTRQAARGKDYRLGFINSLTHTNKWAGAAYAWRDSLQKRANYFSQAMKLKSRGIVKNVLDRYPGLARVS
jgi:hypothetical protein